MGLRPCLVAVWMYERVVVKSAAAVGLRNVPLILSWSLVMRRSRSAWLFVNGTAVFVSTRRMSGS